MKGQEWTTELIHSYLDTLIVTIIITVVCAASVVYLAVLYGSSNHTEKVLSNFVIKPSESEALIEAHGDWHCRRVTFLLLFRHPGPMPGWETHIQRPTCLRTQLLCVSLKAYNKRASRWQTMLKWNEGPWSTRESTLLLLTWGLLIISKKYF